MLQAPCTPVLPRAHSGQNSVCLSPCDTCDLQIQPALPLSGMQLAVCSSQVPALLPGERQTECVIGCRAPPSVVVRGSEVCACFNCTKSSPNLWGHFRSPGGGHLDLSTLSTLDPKCPTGGHLYFPMGDAAPSVSSNGRRFGACPSCFLCGSESELAIPRDSQSVGI